MKKFKELESEGVTLFGPKSSELKGSVFSFHIPGIHPHDLGTILDGMGIAVRTGHHCAQPLMDALGVPSTNRASFWLYNTMDEAKSFVAHLRYIVDRFSDK